MWEKLFGNIVPVFSKNLSEKLKNWSYHLSKTLKKAFVIYCKNFGNELSKISGKAPEASRNVYKKLFLIEIFSALMITHKFFVGRFRLVMEEHLLTIPNWAEHQRRCIEIVAMEDVLQENMKKILCLNWITEELSFFFFRFSSETPFIATISINFRWGSAPFSIFHN